MTSQRVGTGMEASHRTTLDRRLLVTMGAANLGVFLVWGAVPSTMLPTQLEDIDPANKVALVGVVTTVGALCALLAQPIAGALSDRTRSRFGRRAPWLIGGAVAGSAALPLLGPTTSVVAITVLWAIVQITYNLMLGPFHAALPDRVPVAQRGRFSVALGVGMMGGAVGGQVLGSLFASSSSSRTMGYVVLAVAALVGTVVFVVRNPEPSSVDQPRVALRWREFLREFWVSPRQHPDFAWAFLGRLLLVIGYSAVATYQLYILQDHVGLTRDEALDVLPLLGLLGVIASLVTMAISGPLSDRWGRRKIFVISSSAGMAAAMVLPAVFPTVLGMAGYAVVAGMSFGVYIAVDTALMSEVLPTAESAAKDLGILNIAATLPQVMGPGIASAVILTLGGGESYGPLFAVAAVFSLLGAAAIVPIKAVR